MADRLPGVKFPFYLPFRASKRARNDPNATQNDRWFARAVMKDAIGYAFGLPAAPYRASVFDDQDGAPVAANAGRPFMINEQVSAQPYRFFLIPGTQIRGAKVNFSSVAVPVPQLYTVKSVSIWMPGHVTVLQVLAWINGALNGYVEGGAFRELPEQEGKKTEAERREFIARIIKVVTPNERGYNIRSQIITAARPITVPGTPPTPSPTPTPTPTP